MITGLHHISIICSSEVSVLFYEKLGLHIVSRIKREYDCVVVLTGFGIGIELFIDYTHPKRASNPENLGFRQISLSVQDVDEMRKKFDCSEVKTDWFGNRYCNTQDPDGLPIQFIEGNNGRC